MQMQRWQLFFRGHVQGVGFRFTSMQVAKRFAVTGWVKNLPDGSVEMHIQGTPNELELYLDSLQTAISGKISAVEKVVASVDSTLCGFEIRR